MDVLRSKADLFCDQSVAQALTLPLARNRLLVDAEVFGNLGFGVQFGQINDAHETFLLGHPGLSAKKAMSFPQMPNLRAVDSVLV